MSSTPLTETTPLKATVDESGGCCPCCATPTLRALWVAAVGLLIFTIAQLTMSFSANSLELRLDSFFMLIDSATYFVNIYAEYTQSRRWRIGAVLFSVVALLTVTSYMTHASVTVLRDGEEAEGDDEVVDPTVILAFSAINLALDIVALTYIFLRIFPIRGCAWFFELQWLGWIVPRTDAAESAAAMDGAAVPKKMAESDGGSGGSGGSGRNSGSGGSSGSGQGNVTLNLKSATLHVVLDTLRSCTSFVASFVISAGLEEQSTHVDATGAIIISAIAYVALAVLIYELVVEWRDYLNSS